MFISGCTKCIEVACFFQKAYALVTSMVRKIKRNELNSGLKKCRTRYQPFIRATIRQTESYFKPIIQDDISDALISRMEFIMTILRNVCQKMIS